MGIFGCGLSSSWLLGISTIVSPIILPTAIGLTLGIFGGASLVAYKMPKDKILRYGPVLFGSLIGMIGFDVIGILASYFIGPNPLSELIFKTELYGGILLLAGLVAYDTHAAIKEYEKGNADHLGISVDFVQDIWFLMVRFIAALLTRWW